jgi:uncharacterized protein (TIGR02391 family)
MRFSPSKGTKASFADVIPPASLLIVPLEDIAFTILEALKRLKPGSTLMDHFQIGAWARSYPKQDRSAAERRITEAWRLLQHQGYIAQTKVLGSFESWFVTDKGQAVRRPAQLSYGASDLLPIGLLTLPIRESARPLYLAGRFDDACSAAFKEVEIFVRSCCGYPNDVIGVSLMSEAFKPNVGPLADNNAPQSEQKALRDLFVGAIGYFKNPLSHRKLGVKVPAQAASAILLANELVAIAHRHASLSQKNRASQD